MSFKIGNKVSGTTTKGRVISGQVTNIKATAKGNWITVKTADGKEVATRPALLVPMY